MPRDFFTHPITASDTHYSILGVDITTSTRKIAMIRIFDRVNEYAYGGNPDKDRELCKKIQDALEDAHTTLKNRNTRKEYDEWLVKNSVKYPHTNQTYLYRAALSDQILFDFLKQFADERAKQQFVEDVLSDTSTPPFMHQITRKGYANVIAFVLAATKPHQRQALLAADKTTGNTLLDEVLNGNTTRKMPLLSLYTETMTPQELELMLKAKKDGQTPLSYVTKTEWNDEVAIALLRKLVGPGETELHVAARLGNSTLTTFLLENGYTAVINHTNTKGETPYFLAQKHGHHDTMAALANEGGKTRSWCDFITSKILCRDVTPAIPSLATSRSSSYLTLGS